MTRQQQRRFALAGILLLCVTLGGAAASSRASDWHPVWLVCVLAILGIASDRLTAQIGSATITAGFMSVALAMTLLGPAPAVAICVATGIVTAIVEGGLRERPTQLACLWNLGGYAYVLVASLAIRVSVEHFGVSKGSGAYAVVVALAMSAGNFLNFLLASTRPALTTGVSIRSQIRTIYIPTIRWITAPNLLAVAMIMLYLDIGPLALVLMVALLAAFYLLLAELMRSNERSQELQQRSRDLASLQVGVLVTIVKTLSMRDRSTARHSAAVARYAMAIARAAGCTDDEQKAVHTAGLLHDIGKFAFPDRILLASHGLQEGDWEIVKAHPVNGARLVACVEGYEGIATIILSHHERIDGGGYPDGLVGEAIPLLARIISIADIYDVITARDTYRTPVSPEDAIAELRRVSGTQLDGRLVEIFIGVLEQKRLGFAHSGDADFEAELEFERRVRDLAEPRAAVA